MAIDVNFLSDRFDGGASQYDGGTLEEAYIQRKTRAESYFAGIGVDKTASGMSVTVTLKNKGAAAKNICLFPGDLSSKEEINTVVGRTCDGIAGVETITDVTVECTTGLRYFQNFVSKNPTKLRSIAYSVDNEAQLSQGIEFTQSSPFRTLGSQIVTPKSHQVANDANTKLVNIPFDLTHLDDQTQMFIRLGAGRSVELTIFIDAVLNKAKAYMNDDEVLSAALKA